MSSRFRGDRVHAVSSWFAGANHAPTSPDHRAPRPSMTYIMGDQVHVAGLGKGLVLEVLNNGRLRVEMKGRVLIATSQQITRAEPTRPSSTRRRSAATTAAHDPAPGEPPAKVRTLDLHGRTVLEA